MHILYKEMFKLHYFPQQTNWTNYVSSSSYLKIRENLYLEWGGGGLEAGGPVSCWVLGPKKVFAYHLLVSNFDIGQSNEIFQPPFFPS